MPRLLPIFLALVTLSACQRDAPGPETSPESPEAHRVTTSSWALPWHYVGGPSCLLNGRPAPAQSGKVLIPELLALPDSTLLSVLSPTQVGDPADGLLAFVRDNWGAALKDGYAFDAWPAGLALQLRETEDARLDPQALVLPWPFPGDTDGALRKRLEDAQEAAGLSPIPPLGPVSAASVLVDPILHVGDEIVTNAAERAAFERDAKGKGCNVERDWLADQIGPAFPRNFTACTDDSLLTTQTRWEWSSTSADSLHFRLGWQQQALAAPMYDRWPCGVFRGY